MSSSALPDELWRQILEIGVHRRNLTFKDLCSLSITSSRFRQLSSEDNLWSHLLSSDFSVSWSYCPSLSSSKSTYQFRFERDREKKRAAKRKALMNKERKIAVHLARVKELASLLAEWQDRKRATLAQLSRLNETRQNAVSAESRVHTLEMELELCREQISGFEGAYNQEKQRFDDARKEFKSLKFQLFGRNKWRRFSEGCSSRVNAGDNAEQTSNEQ